MNTLLALLSSAFILQGEEINVNSHFWGVYYNEDTLSCNVVSQQGDITVILRKSISEDVGELFFNSEKWKFTYTTKAQLPTSLQFSNGEEINTLITYLYDKNLPTSIRVVIDYEKLFRHNLVKYTVQFNAKSKLSIDMLGLLYLQGTFNECIQNLQSVTNSFPELGILKKTDRSE